MNTWSHTNVCQLFVFDQNTWYRITVKTKQKKNPLKQDEIVNINIQWTRFPNLKVRNNPRRVDMPLINQSFLHSIRSDL